jgi:hypothetical protein
MIFAKDGSPLSFMASVYRTPSEKAMFHVKRGGMTFSFCDFFLFGEKKKVAQKRKA